MYSILMSKTLLTKSMQTHVRKILMFSQPDLTLTVRFFFKWSKIRSNLRKTNTQATHNTSSYIYFRSINILLHTSLECHNYGHATIEAKRKWRFIGHQQFGCPKGAVYTTELRWEFRQKRAMSLLLPYSIAVSHPSFLHLFEPKLTDKLEMRSEQRK